MKKISIGNEKIAKLISSKNIKEDKEYRWSLYTYVYSEENIHLLLNILSGEVYVLDAREYNAMLKLKTESARGIDIRKNGLEELVYNRILVENNYNEKNKYLSTIELLKIMSKKKNGIETYTVFPTTACNARCTYCYEKDFISKTMTKQTADRVIEYIEQTKCDDRIRLNWFGGEPTVAHDMISYICRELISRGVEYQSTMISNAVLFDENLADEAAYVWRLKRIQVSLDGERRDYEARKNFFAPERHNYNTVMQAVQLLAERGIKIFLRCNYDRDNISRIKMFVDDLSRRFASTDKVSVYFSVLYQEKEADDYMEQYRAMDEFYRYCEEKKVRVRSDKVKKIGLKTNMCMADNMKHSVVIDPEGKLYACEHLSEDGTWGNIFDGITNPERYEQMVAPYDVEEECAHCTFLPICTPFYRKGCPVWSRYCKDVNCTDLDRQLHNLITNLKEDNEPENDA